ncbi:hypothetical protein K502DRAFT_368731 [Neoconidiobolus thromboides FSU 785]|nr:hypothetical protein K502DRAFT_368731 [Neoconidiobolus thromboides FSU 785]
MNQVVYKLDLNKGFKLSNRIAPWDKLAPSNLNQTMIQPSVFRFSSKGENKIMAIFRESGPFGTAYYDISKNSWTIDNGPNTKLLTFLRALKFDTNLGLENRIIFNFLQNDIVNNQLILYGFQSISHNKITKSTTLPLILYNIETGIFQKTDIELLDSMKTCFVYNGKLYLLGGTSENGNKLPMNKIKEVNFSDNKIKDISLNGEIPNERFYSKFQVIRDILYLFTSKEGDKNVFYMLDMVTFKWSKRVVNFQVLELSCLISYKDLVITSFGSRKDSESSGQTRIFNIRTWEEVDNVPGNNSSNIEKSDIRKEDTNNANSMNKEKDNPTNIPMIAGIIGSLFFILLIVFILLLIYYKRKMDKKHKLLESIPKTMTEPVTLFVPKIENMKLDLSHYPYSTCYSESIANINLRDVLAKEKL